MGRPDGGRLGGGLLGRAELRGAAALRPVSSAQTRKPSASSSVATAAQSKDEVGKPWLTSRVLPSAAAGSLPGVHREKSDTLPQPGLDGLAKEKYSPSEHHRAASDADPEE